MEGVKMLPFDVLKSLESNLRTILSTCTHRELEIFWNKCDIPPEILQPYYGCKPQAPPGYYVMGPSKKQIIEGIVEEVDSQGSLGVLNRILHEAIRYGKTLTSEETQQALNNLERLKERIVKREVGVAELGKEERERERVELEGKGKREEPESLREQFLALIRESNHQKRGYNFQDFLYELFDLSGLKPLAPFKVTGEQIDGGFEFKSSTYLLEARWRNKPANESDLLVLSERVRSRIEGTKGVFISVSGYSSEAVPAFVKGRRPNIILLDGTHIMAVLEGRITLVSMLEKMLRVASSTAEIYTNIESILS